MICVKDKLKLSQEKIKTLLHNTKDTREYERLLCISYSMKGYSAIQISELLYRDEKTICQWIKSFNGKGLEGIERQHPPGKTKLVSESQIAQLCIDFEKSPREFGFNQGYWSSKNLIEHIKRATGIKYSKSRISELMHEWGFEVKRPRMKSIRRDEEERQSFLNSLKSKVAGIKKKLYY